MKTKVLTENIIKTTVGLVLITTSVLIACGAAQGKTGETPFPRPPEIKKAVDFWTRVYTEIDSNSGFIHDSRVLDIVYEVYPLSANASPKQQHRSIRNRVRHYEKLLRKIAETPETDLSREERRIKRLWGPGASLSKLGNAAERIRFQRGQSDRMKTGLKRAAAYEARIRKILRDKGVPEQLAALPHVESSYNPRVRSKAGAAGLWQIMPATGRRYLRVNNVLDERLDPYKAMDCPGCAARFDQPAPRISTPLFANTMGVLLSLHRGTSMPLFLRPMTFLQATARSSRKVMSSMLRSWS